MVIRLIQDQLNTHSHAVRYSAFPAEEARRLARKLELHHTPTEVTAEIAAWKARRNAAKATVNWRFTIDQTRQKLLRLDPT